MFKKSASLKDRANAALLNLQRNSYAMGLLRSRLESRINFALGQKGGGAEGCRELTKVLELVKNGELILHDMSEKIESARFLEEFVAIMDSAASSVSEIKSDLEQMVPAAEAALEEIHDAISKASNGLTVDLRQEIEPAILAEVMAAMAVSKTGVHVEEEQTATPIQDEEQSEPMPA